MPKLQPTEADFSKWFRKNYKGWCERVEPAMGMNPGFPDLLALTPATLLPIELKIGTIEDDVLWCSEIRPTQIAWHRNFANHGSESVFVIGVWNGKWLPYIFDGTLAANWDRTGFKIGVEAHPLIGDLETSVASFMSDTMGI